MGLTRLATAIVFAIETVLCVVAALCLAGLTGLVLLQVALRYGGGGVPAFTEEIARYAMIFMALLASAVAVREASHIRIDTVPLLLARIAPGLRRALEAVLDTLSLGIFLVVAWYGVDMVRFASIQLSDGLRIPLSYPYVIVPVAFSLAALFALARLLLPAARAPQGEEPGKGP
ncbi:MAG: TRAP transporter small permease [Pseudomonadota bacterium]